jgi:hypothetical protein
MITQRRLRGRPIVLRTCPDMLPYQGSARRQRTPARIPVQTTAIVMSLIASITVKVRSNTVSGDMANKRYRR